MGERLLNINSDAIASLHTATERLEMPGVGVDSLSHKDQTILYNQQWRQEKEARRFHNLSLFHGKRNGDVYIRGKKV